MANCGTVKNQMGGKRKGKGKGKATKKRSTRKLSNGASNWQSKVMKVYKEMKAKNPKVKLGDAMKRASELKKKGQL
jgi:hypothetical protein